MKEGRKVLYTGTPCQIAGLRLFLNNDYDNLLTADVACHGVPSPMVWRHYLQYKIDEAQSSRRNKVLNIREISFRDKSTGWRGYSLMLKFSDNNDSDIVVKESVGKNLFMQGFLKDLYLRPSCYNCPFKSGRSGSDLTLADFWGINKHMPELDDNGGVSLVFINTQKGRIFYESLLLENHTATYEQAVSGNPVLVRPVKEPLQRIDFWKRYSSEKTKAIRKIVCEMQPSFLLKCLGKIKRTLKR